MKVIESNLESQLVVRGQAVTRGSTPKATLLEPCLFRKFVANCLLTESYDEGVAFVVLQNGWDSNLDMLGQHLKPNHHGPYDAHHLADQSGPNIQEAILFLPRVQSGPDTVKELRCGGSLG